MGDNTKKKKQQGETNDYDDIYREIVTSTNTLIWRTDAEGRLTFVNPAWEKGCGYSADEMIGRPFSEFQVPEAAEHYINAFRNCLIGESVIGLETMFFSKDGKEIHLAINMIPLYGDDGNIRGTQGTAFDITELKHADDILQYISAKDELTGLYNLHTFLSMTEQQIKTAHREQKEILIIYTGVDNMATVNDELGYDKGDQILIDIANILQKTFREADILARTGGDEFVVSTLVSSSDTKEMIMTRLQENVDKYNAGKSGAARISISFGTSVYNPAKPVSINDLLSGADENMHENKKAARS